MTAALLDEPELAQLRTALDGFTVDAVDALLGLPGQAALARADLVGAARGVRSAPAGELTTFVRLFLLGAEVAEHDARRAFHPLPLDAARAGGLITVSAGSVQALVDIRPHTDGDARWWVVSDLGADVRPGPLAADHVLGIGPASVTLAQATPRLPVGRALDVGTGSGVQALHLSGHAGEVVATDVSRRALRLAATTAALSGQSWSLRHGSLLAPVQDEQFDLVVANPPFVVSGGAVEHDYRDSGIAADGVSAQLMRGVPSILRPGGSAHLLANWIIPVGAHDWRDRPTEWLAGGRPDRRCDAWVWQREVADLGEYVSLWLRDAGLRPDMPQWQARYDAWQDWFVDAGIAAVGMGLVSLWRTDDEPVIVLEDVPQHLEQPIGASLPGWVARQRWLAATDDAAILASRLRAAPDVVRERTEVLSSDGWRTAASSLRQGSAMRWQVDVDDAVAGVVGACDGVRVLAEPVAVLAAALSRPVAEVTAALLPVVRDLVGRGFLVPAEPA